MMQPPNIGAKHFKSEVNTCRKSNYTGYTAIAELCDGSIDEGAKRIRIDFRTNDGIVNKIIYSDDTVNGFQGLTNESVDNPLNMGHQTSNHNDNNKLCQNGVGTKAAMINLANETTLITFDRENDKYYEMKNDYVKMCETNDINDSYNPTGFIELSKKQFMDKRPRSFDSGSSIVLNRLTSMANMNLDNLSNYLQESYGSILQDNKLSIELLYDNYSVFVSPFESPINTSSSAKLTITHQLTIIKENDINIKFLAKRTSNKKTAYIEFIKKGDSYVYTEILFRKYKAQIENSITQGYEIFNLIMNSTSTYRSDYRNKYGAELLSRNNIHVIFNGRCLGKSTYDPEKEGWSNHIHNELTVFDKSVCSMLGVSYYKEVPRYFYSPLTQVLDCLQRKIKGKIMLHKEAIDKMLLKCNQVSIPRLHINNEDTTIVQTTDTVTTAQVELDLQSDEESNTESEAEPVVEVEVSNIEPEPVVEVEVSNIETEAEPVVEVSNIETIQDTSVETDSVAEPEPTQANITISANVIQELESLLTKAKYEQLPRNWFLLEAQLVLTGVFDKSMVE